ncbi:MAG: putative metal-binding motif-containing protein [Bradymonadaceae bacterium]|nr:putative metal-binding motif-containing protein [Lujinxingiaceae bacterium]
MTEPDAAQGVPDTALWDTSEQIDIWVPLPHHDVATTLPEDVCTGCDDTEVQSDTSQETDTSQEADTPSAPDVATPGCPTDACLVGSRQCVSNTTSRSCVANANGCGTWRGAETCAGGGRCEANACLVCVDNDGDGRGQGCALGADCNDNDATVYAGATEICDGKDNNCNNTIDEGFNVGQSCAVGVGECRRTGQLVCTANHLSTRCNATAGSPTAEVCNGLDDNCDGTPDSGGVCAGCVEDAYEPNNSSLTGTLLNVGQTLQMKMCPADGIDWFRLGSYSAGQTVFVEILFSQDHGNLDMEMYVGGNYETGSHTSTSNESINRVLVGSGNVAVRVYYKAGTTERLAGVGYTIRR